MKRVPVLAAIPAVLLAAGAVAGCAGTTVVHTNSAKAELRSLDGGTDQGPRTGPTAPPVTSSPVTADGMCPFLDTDVVQEILGQHLSRTTTSSSVPVSCTFYRPDGAVAASIERRTLAGASEAAAAARTVTGTQASPVTDLGDGGTVAITADGAVLAVTDGAVEIVVRINQQSSLECHELASRALPE